MRAMKVCFVVCALRKRVIAHTIAWVVLERGAADGSDDSDDLDRLPSLLIVYQVLADGALVGPVLFRETRIDHHDWLGLCAIFGRDPAPGQELDLHHFEVIGGGVGDAAVWTGIIWAQRTAYDTERTRSSLLRIEGKRIDGCSGRDSGLRGDIVNDGVDESGLAWLALAEILAGVVDGGGDNTMGIESRINVLKLPQAGQASPGEQQERESDFSDDECAAKALLFRQMLVELRPPSCKLSDWCWRRSRSAGPIPAMSEVRSPAQAVNARTIGSMWTW